MQTVTTIGLDIAKSEFHVHGVATAGNVFIRRQLKRPYLMTFFHNLPPCLLRIEACASSHHWSRELQAIGHSVRLMPPAYVKPYVKRHKNDATDAEAICEAVTRPNMRFVATKTPDQQSCLMLHRTRHLFIRQQTSVIYVIRVILQSSDNRAGRTQWCQHRPGAAAQSSSTICCPFSLLLLNLRPLNLRPLRSAPVQPAPPLSSLARLKGACAQIRAACTQAGFVPNGVNMGVRSGRDFAA